MQRIDQPLLSPSLGSQKTVASFHFGTKGARPKIYIQASLHAEELPGMLVAHHLRALLDAADRAGLIQGEIILVPVANPIGLAQRLDHKPMGRFELDTSENFNRHYPKFSEAILEAIKDKLSGDAQTNVRQIRQAMGEHLINWQPSTELQSLRRTLLSLSFDADFMLDLHCDCEGVLHFYTEEACWPQLAPLAQLLGSRAILLARNSGSGPIDESLSGVWWQLAESLSKAGIQVPVPQGCCSTTIELRGELDIRHDLAKPDAQSIYAFLQHCNAIRCDLPPVVPAALCEATPLAGSETLHATSPGVVVFAADVGQRLAKGDLVAEIIDPVAGTTSQVLAGVSGVFYARIRDRYITAGGEIGKIAGSTPFRTGELLGA